MSIVFEIERPEPIGVITVVVRNPEYGDVSEEGRRQAESETEAGQQYIQDRGIELEFYQATWTNLTQCERRDLEYFFGPDGANKRQRPFILSVIYNTNLAFPIGTDQGGSTSDGLNTGDLLTPTSASFGRVRLEQSRVQFTAIVPDRYTTSLRFRILKPLTC